MPCSIVKVVSTTPIRLSVIAVALFLFVGTLQADIFVSRFDNGQVDKYDDAGQNPIRGFLKHGGGASEGFACVKLSQNRIFAANNNGTIGIYDINTGNSVGSYTVGNPLTTKIAALAISIDGTILYAADYGDGIIYALDSSNGLVKHMVVTTASHDIVVGPNGHVYATYFNKHMGVREYSSTLTFISTFIPDSVLPYAGGMVFDGSGNLWVTNTGFAGAADGIWKFTGPLNAQPGQLLSITADPNAFPLGLDISPINPPGPAIDTCNAPAHGCIVVAELNGKGGLGMGSISQIDPSTCTGTIGSPGTCQFATPNPYINDLGQGAQPKYVHFSENCADTGYVEICKMSCLSNPVSGNFTFTATNAGDSIGPITIPVNACSGPVQIPNGTVTIDEQFPGGGGGGTQVTNIVAYDYDYQGDQISALLSFNLPFQTGNVNVVSGDISTETVVGFTNCKSGPGELKICKVAGPGVPLNMPFSFEVEWLQGGFFQFAFYTVPAGPPPGGYCEIAGNYPVGTLVSVSEPYLPAGTAASNITVAPADRGGFQQLGGCSGGLFGYCPLVDAIIDSGTTEVTFTNTTMGSRPR